MRMKWFCSYTADCPSRIYKLYCNLPVYIMLKFKLLPAQNTKEQMQLYFYKTNVSLFFCKLSAYFLKLQFLRIALNFTKKNDLFIVIYF